MFRRFSDVNRGNTVVNVLWCVLLELNWDNGRLFCKYTRVVILKDRHLSSGTT